MEPKLVQVTDLVKEYPAPGKPLSVLAGVSFQLGAGGLMAVMGPSGSGKSTLLNILGTLDSPTSGTILFEGEDVQKFDAERKAKFRNRQIGFIFQDHHLLPQCTAIENILIPCLASGRATSEERDRAEDILDRVGLAARRDAFPARLSGGERQRVAIARAMINQPRLLLCDEPTGDLDAENSANIGRLLVSLRDAHNVAVIVVTHNPEFARMFGKCMTLSQGKLHE